MNSRHRGTHTGDRMRPPARTQTRGAGRHGQTTGTDAPAACIAGWVPQGARIADVGTDHAYLPVWLTLHGRVASAIASDLRPGPLDRPGRPAGASAWRSGSPSVWATASRPSVRRSAITVVIAGMGGENIAMILSRALWTADGDHTLLLQPQVQGGGAAHLPPGPRLRHRPGGPGAGPGAPLPGDGGEGGADVLTLGQRLGGAKLLRDPLGDRYLMEKILQRQSAVAGLNRSADPADLDRADRLREEITASVHHAREWRHANCPEIEQALFRSGPQRGRHGLGQCGPAPGRPGG